MDQDANLLPSFRIQRFFAFLLKYWWVPVLTLALSLGGAIWYFFWEPPTYVSKSRMWETVTLRLPEGAMFSEDMQNFLGTQTELLESGQLRQLALARLSAPKTNAIPLGKDGQPLEVQIRVRQAAKSSVFELEASAADAAYVQAYLNALMIEYIQYKKDIRKVVSGDTLASISEQVLRLERDLKSEQENLVAFQRTNNLAIVQQEATIAGGSLARLSTELSDGILQTQVLESRALGLEANGPLGGNVSVDLNGPLLGADSEIPSTGTSERQGASRDLELLKLQRERLSKFLRPKHPKIAQLDTQIQRAEKLIELFRNQSREQIAAAQQVLKLKMNGIQTSIKESLGKVLAANDRIADAERMKMNISRIQFHYDRVVNLLQNVDISRNIDQGTLAILDPASEAVRSYKQDVSLLAMTLVAGLLAGFGCVFLVAVRDDRFITLADVIEKLGDAVLGQVPEVRKRRRKSPLPLLEIDDDRHVYAESYRNLRSALLYQGTDGQRPRVLLVTSAVPNEGKSTVAANLARILALGGSRVLLVDGDLRKGALHELMGMNHEPGLSEMLRCPEDLEKIIQTNSLPNFFFVSSGGRLSNPGDLFLNPALSQVLAWARQHFDYVLIDSSPVFAADDTATLAPMVDGTLFVVRNRFSRPRPAREALELLFQRQAKVLGLVFNRADASERSHYSHY